MSPSKTLSSANHDDRYLLPPTDFLERLGADLADGLAEVATATARQGRMLDEMIEVTRLGSKGREFIPLGILSTPEVLTAEQADRLRQAWENRHRVSDGVPIMEKWKEPKKLLPKDLLNDLVRAENVRARIKEQLAK